MDLKKSRKLERPSKTKRILFLKKFYFALQVLLFIAFKNEILNVPPFISNYILGSAKVQDVLRVERK
jgi:hypothetical protein